MCIVRKMTKENLPGGGGVVMLWWLAMDNSVSQKQYCIETELPYTADIFAQH